MQIIVDHAENKISYLFLQDIEVVNNHTNEEIKREESSKYNKHNKVYVRPFVLLITWLVIWLESK